MKNIFILTIAVMYTLTSPVNALAKTDSGRRGAVEVSVSASCDACSMDGYITLHSSVENLGETPITIYSPLGWGGLAGFTMHIANSAGVELKNRALDDGLIVPSTLDDTSYYVKLFTHHALTLSAKIPVNELFVEAGEYTLWVDYRSPVPARASLISGGFISREDGSFSSNKIVIVVK